MGFSNESCFMLHEKLNEGNTMIRILSLYYGTVHTIEGRKHTGKADCSPGLNFYVQFVLFTAS